MSAQISVHAGDGRQYVGHYRVIGDVSISGSAYIEMHVNGERVECTFYLHDPENAKTIGEAFLKAAQELAALPVAHPVEAPKVEESIPF